MEQQLKLAFNTALSKWALTHTSDRGHITTITIETEELVPPQEIKNILEEVMISLQVYFQNMSIG